MGGRAGNLASCCDHCNEPSGSIKCRAFLDWRRKILLLKETALREAKTQPNLGVAQMAVSFYKNCASDLLDHSSCYMCCATWRSTNKLCTLSVPRVCSCAAV